MHNYTDIESLSVELPEDILKKKWYGDFEAACHLIDLRLAQPIPEMLKKKLRLEKAIMKQLEVDYPYTYEEALAMVREKIPDFTEEEFRTLEEENKIDWIYVRGEVHYLCSFLSTLLSVNKSIASRAAAYEEKLLEELGELNGVTQLTEAVQQPAAAKLPETVRKKRREDALDRKKGELSAETIRTIKEKKRLKYHYHMRASLWIDEDAFVPGKILAHIPIPKRCEQYSNIKLLSIHPEPYQIASENEPQRTVSFWEDMQENHEFVVEYEFDSEIHYADPDPSVVAGVLQPVLSMDEDGNAHICERSVPGARDAVPAEEKREYLVYKNSTPVCVEDLSEQAPHICFTPFLKALAAEIAGDEKNPYLLAKRVYDYITTRITYSYMREYFAIENISEYAALGGKGDCGVQTLLFITLCRILKVPARWQSGLNANPYGVSSHDWAQFFVAPYGWLFADCSFGGSGYRNGNEEKRQFYFGNLDPFRMVANSSYQKEFNPPKKHLRADPYDNQRGELEYEDHGMTFEHISCKREVLEVTKVG